VGEAALRVRHSSPKVLAPRWVGVTGSVASLARFRSLQRGIAVLVGLIPVVALHTVVPGVVPGVTVGDLVLFIAPAVISVLGIAYAIRRLPVEPWSGPRRRWGCCC
jgi:hypothetical protein